MQELISIIVLLLALIVVLVGYQMKSSTVIDPIQVMVPPQQAVPIYFPRPIYPFPRFGYPIRRFSPPMRLPIKY
jgi:hypothetical protein